MANGITHLERGIHLVRDTDIARYLRKELNDPDLMTFYHTQTEKWILGLWINKTRGIVDEIDDIGHEYPTEYVTRAFVERLRRTKVTDPKTARRRMLRAEKAEMARRAEIDAQIKEGNDYLAKRGYGRIAFG